MSPETVAACIYRRQCNNNFERDRIGDKREVDNVMNMKIKS
jgi:hypothetical protein